MLKVGIIGVGKLGSIHLRIYREIKEIKKIYLVDIDKKSLSSYKASDCFSDYRLLRGKVDLVSIATPTSTHFEIARFFLKNKIPVLVEKPLGINYQEADALIKIAKKHKILLTVGHVERYNNAYLAIKKIVKNPLFIECHRLSPYPYRSLDVSVVLDLMIHDLDIILDLVKDEVKRIEAKGVKVLSSTEDIANVRLSFKNGCVANITSSRISTKKERKIRIFMPKCYISLDYANQSVEIYQKSKKNIKRRLLSITKEEPLKKEITHFVESAKRRRFMIESALRARDALKLACRIEKAIQDS
jgi:predicted dehydrogenase